MCASHSPARRFSRSFGSFSKWPYCFPTALASALVRAAGSVDNSRALSTTAARSCGRVVGGGHRHAVRYSLRRPRQPRSTSVKATATS